MNSTSTDQRLHTENPTCSEKIEKIRLRRATFLPDASQNATSSGRPSSIHFPPVAPPSSGGAAVVVVINRPSVDRRPGGHRDCLVERRASGAAVLTVRRGGYRGGTMASRPRPGRCELGGGARRARTRSRREALTPGRRPPIRWSWPPETAHERLRHRAAGLGR